MLAVVNLNVSFHADIAPRHRIFAVMGGHADEQHTVKRSHCVGLMCVDGERRWS
jgi:hypothetical protein